LSPAIDYIINLEDIESLNKLTPNKFKSNKRNILPAGKGINESIIINSFGIPTLALHYSGGFTGDFLEKEIKNLKINQIRFNSPIVTRINLKINIGTDYVNNYELSELPPLVDSLAKEKIINTINNLSDKDILSIAGSFNKDDFNFIDEICNIAHTKNIKLVYDLSTKEILKLLKYKPLLIKPNNFELEKIFNTKVEKEEDYIKYMKKLIKLGAKNVVLTLGSEGSLMITSNNEFYEGKIINPIELISPQGSGDSFIGAFLAKVNIKEQIEECFK